MDKNTSSTRKKTNLFIAYSFCDGSYEIPSHVLYIA